MCQALCNHCYLLLIDFSKIIIEFPYFSNSKRIKQYTNIQSLGAYRILIQMRNPEKSFNLTRPVFPNFVITMHINSLDCSIRIK